MKRLQSLIAVMLLGVGSIAASSQVTFTNGTGSSIALFNKKLIASISPSGYKKLSLNKDDFSNLSAFLLNEDQLKNAYECSKKCKSWEDYRSECKTSSYSLKTDNEKKAEKDECATEKRDKCIFECYKKHGKTVNCDAFKELKNNLKKSYTITLKHNKVKKDKLVLD